MYMYVNDGQVVGQSGQLVQAVCSRGRQTFETWNHCDMDMLMLPWAEGEG